MRSMRYIPEPAREEDKPFLMAIEDVFSIEGRGTVATGRIERGVIKTGEEVEIVGLHDESKPRRRSPASKCSASCWTKVGPATTWVACCVVSSAMKSSVVRYLAKPGSITPHTKFEAEVYCLSKDEGGRHTPFFSGYRPQFYFRTTDVTGTANLVEAEMCMPGDNVKVTVELHKPIAMDDGVRFAIREGGRTVGSGVVTKIVE